MKRSDLHFAGIYKFTNKANGKVYIGQSKNIFKRLCGHKRLRGKTQFVHALRKYGFGGFTFQVLERVDNLDLLNEREQYWMDFYQCCNHEKGYNIRPTAGSQRGFKMSPERIKEMSIIGKRLYENGFRPFAGRVLSQESIERIRQKSKLWRPSPEQREKFLKNNKPPTPEQCKVFGQLAVERFQCKIRQIDIKTRETVKIWDSLNDLKDNSTFNPSGVDKACRGYYFGRERKEYIAVDSYMGFKWERITDGKIIRPQKTKVVLKAKQRYKRIAQIDLQTNLIIKIWDFVADIERELGLKKASIQNACRGYWYNSRTKKRLPKLCFAGYKWKYVEE